MSDSSPASSNSAKRLARLVAVQALYQNSYGEEELNDILKACIDDADTHLNAQEDGDTDITERPDPELFKDIVRGVESEHDALNEILAGALEGKSSSDRMERLLRAILLAGVYELYHHTDISTGVIINDYVDVTRAFFQAKEPGLINALLDKVAKKLRS